MGLLPAHRVGRRRERRFSEPDLVAFMSRSAETAGGKPTVNVAGVSTTVPAHLATLFCSDAAGLRLTVPFLAEGVRLHQPCFLVAPGDVLQRYADAIDLKGGIELVRFNGSTTAAVLEQWEQTFADVLARGPTVMRIVGEMAEVCSMFASEAEMLSYEEALDLMIKRFPAAVICQYDVRKFDGVAILRALKAHPDLFDYRTGAFLS